MDFPKDVQQLLSDITTKDPHAVANVQALKDVFVGAQNHHHIREYVTGEMIVQKGHITDSVIRKNQLYSYAAVPLGIILNGSVTVLHGGKGVRKLEAGDFVGLFETSDWIVNSRTRHIGDWTLVAENTVSVLYVDPAVLDNSTDVSRKFREYLSSLARIDRVPKPLSDLPLLDLVASHTTDTRLSDCAIIVHTHIFPTSVALFRHLAHLVDFGNIFVLDKPYSTIRSSLHELIKMGIDVTSMTTESTTPYEFSLKKGIDLLWQRVIETQKKRGFKKILIIDDGGDIWLSIPWADLEEVQIAGVEQTQRGITRIEGGNFKVPPIVSVASSGVKKIIEASFIGSAVVAKLKALGVLDRADKIGILGTGSIGTAVRVSLKDAGKEVVVYDNTMTSNSPAAMNSADELMREADLIIGTTGDNSLQGVVLDKVQGTKILASASSSDIEFQSLIRQGTHGKDFFETVHVPVHEGLIVEILNGGFPINFDREKEWEPVDDIVLTRCLLYIGIMQAAAILTHGKKMSGIYTLDKTAQEKTLTQWLHDKRVNGKGYNHEYEDVSKIVNATFLAGARTMPTVWKE